MMRSKRNKHYRQLSGIIYVDLTADDHESI
jgi:hypothetical protein